MTQAHSPEPAPTAADADALARRLQRGLDLELGGDVVAARRVYQAVLDSSPRNFEALQLLGELERRAGQVQTATTHLRAAALVAPGSSDVLAGIAASLAQSGDYPGALKAHSRALAVDPHYAPTYVGLGQTFLRNGRDADALRCFRKACELDPDHVPAHFHFAQACERQGLVDEALTHYRRVDELAPTYPGLNAVVGALLQQTGRHEQALSCLDAARRESPADVERILACCRSLVAVGRNGEALRSCQKVLQAQPRNAGALVLMGQVYLAENDVAAARRCFDSVLALGASRHRGEASLGLADLCAREDQESEALEHLANAAAAGAGGAGAAQLRARLLRRSGDAEQAVRVLEAALQGARCPPGQRADLHQLAGHACEDLGRYPYAFFHFVTAADLRLAANADDGVQEPQPEGDYFSAVRLARLSRAPFVAAQPLIIVGLPGAGRHLLRQILSVHSLAHVPVESVRLADVAAALPEMLGSGKPYPQCLEDARRADLAEVVARFWPSLPTLPERSVALVSDAPDADCYLGLLTVLFPAARMVCISRDPADHLLAAFCGDLTGARPAYTLELRECANRLAWHRSTLSRFRALRELPALEISREQLIADPLTTTDRVLGFVNLSVEPACLRFDAAPQRRSETLFHAPVFDPSIGRAENYASLIGERLEAALAAAGSGVDDGGR